MAPYSPTLTHVISSSGRYLKSVVYKDPLPKALEDLKNNVKREIRRIKPQTLEKVYHSVLARLRNVLARKGAWIEHLMNAWGQILIFSKKYLLVLLNSFYRTEFH